MHEAMRILLISLILLGCSTSDPRSIFGDDYAVVKPTYLENGERAIDLQYAWTPRYGFSMCGEPVCSRKFLPNHDFFIRPGRFIIGVFCRRENQVEPNSSGLIEVSTGIPSIEIIAEKGKVYTVDCEPIGNELNLSVSEGT